MTEQAADLVVRKSITVGASQERAFSVFTDGMATWWPLETHHIGDRRPDTVVLEPGVGGRWYERAAGGTECDWGRVLVWEPPSRLVLSWQISAGWDPDPTIEAEVEVRFAASGAASTRVELEHRGLATFGDRAAEVFQIFDSGMGWSSLLARFAGALDA